MNNQTQGSDSDTDIVSGRAVGYMYLSHGTKCNKTGKYSEAEPCFVQALYLFRYEVNDDDNKHVAQTLNHFGVNYCALSQYSEAEKCLTQALSMYTDLSEGADSVDIADTLCNLAVCYLNRGNKQAAKEKFAKAHNIYMKVDPTNPHIHIIQTYLSLTSECNEKVYVDGAKRKVESDNNESSSKSRKLSQ